MTGNRAIAIVWIAGLGACSDAGVLQLDSGADAEADTAGDPETGEVSTGAPTPDAGTPEPGAMGSGCWPEPPSASVSFVRVDGDDALGDGSQEAPWATIGHAVASVSDGSRIEVGPGEYRGGQTLEGIFTQGVVVRATPSYQARLRHSATVVTLARVQGLTLEGFDIAHDQDAAEPFVVHVRDEMGAVGGDEFPTRIVFRDNIFHDSYNNDLLRIDSGVAGVTVEGNVFYNQGPTDEHLDINAASDVVVRRNIFFNEFEASGRSSTQDTGSFVIIKDANGSKDGIEGASDVDIDGNIFMSWQGNPAMNFLLLAENGNPIYEARGVRVQNNLMLGDGGDVMRSPFGVKGATDVVVRNNTVVGDIPASAFAFRLNVEGDSPPNDGISFFNNIWSSPSGTIDDLTDTEFVSPLENFVLDTNGYWNGGLPIPVDDFDAINADSDSNPVFGDPGLELVALVNPIWDADAATFAGGESTICGAFDQLVARHAIPAADGAGVDAARADQLPAHDILGRLRTRSDLGAVQGP